MFKPALAALSALALVTGCSGPASVKQARQNVDTFHAHFNAGDYPAIWKASSSDLTGTTSQLQFFGLLNGVRNHYGKVVSTEQQGWRYDTNNGNSFSRLEMKTTFEKGSAYEQFTYRNLDGGKQQLAGWSIGKDRPPSDSGS